MPRKVLRPTKYECPTCRRWYGEHMNTGRLAQHHAKGPDEYALCHGSYTPLEGLPVREGETPLPPSRTRHPGQLPLFPHP